MVMVFGEITTKSSIDYQKIIRETVKRIASLTLDRYA